jgi:hypothetical protein
MKNQFTDYNYGYMTTDGKYFHPEQVVQTVVFDGKDSYVEKYFVRGTNTEVEPVKMTKLVKPVNGGRIDDKGKKQVVVGTLPTSAFCLKKNPEAKFLDNQIAKVKQGDGSYKYYIKGFESLEGSVKDEAECLPLPQSYDISYIKADGTGTETRTAVDEGVSEFNKTGDPRID